MNLIAAVDRHWGIGKEGRLLAKIPEDLRLFRRITLHKTVIMGRKTLESLPGGKPLDGRDTVILSRDPKYRVAGAMCLQSVEQARKALSHIPSGEVFVAGGGEIYRDFLPYCDTAYVTFINGTYEADTFFPNLDEDPQWKMEEETEEFVYLGLGYRFCRYVRIL